MSDKSVSVLVVCLGNICRSPIGEAVLGHVASKRGLNVTVDSAGTAAYHVGEEPDERAIRTCKESKVPISHTARQVSQNDFDKFDYILAADEANLRNLERLKPQDSRAEVKLWGSYLDNRPIQDPYYGDIGGFEECFKQVVELSNAFLDEVYGKPQSVE